MTPIRSIALPNGLSLDILDASRPLAADTVKVVLVARVAVAFAPELFDEPRHYDAVVAAFGHQGAYTYHKERTFVSAAEKDAVFAALLDDFLRDTLAYLSHPDFARGFARAKAREALALAALPPHHRPEPAKETP